MREQDIEEYGNSPYVDFQLGETHYYHMVTLKALGIYKGDEENGLVYARPQENQTKGQSFLVAYRILNRGQDAEGISPVSDLLVEQQGGTPTSQLIENSARFLDDEGYLEGIIEDCDGQRCVRADDAIMRWETVTLFMNILNGNCASTDGSGNCIWSDTLDCTAESFADVSSGDPYFDAIMDACSLRLVKGFSCPPDNPTCTPEFRPLIPTTRAQWATIVARAYFVMSEGTASPTARTHSQQSDATFTAADSLIRARENIFGQPAVAPPFVYRISLPLVANNALGMVIWPPSTPSNLQAQGLDTSRIRLTWNDNSDNEDGFRVYRWNGIDFQHWANVGSNGTTFIDTSLNCGSGYAYKVSAYNDGGESTRTPWVEGFTDSCSEPPAAPSNLWATALDSTRIRLAWTDNSDNEDGFRVYRWNGITFQHWANVGPNVTAFIDASLDCGSGYAYRVSAYNSDGESAHTPWVEGFTDPCSVPPTAPSNLQATAIDSTRIRLTWADNSNNEDGFYIHNGYYHVATVGPNTTSYIVTGLQPGSWNCHRIYAFNDAGSSSWTGWACDTTLFSYYDDFGDPGSGWPTIYDSRYRTGYQSGEYQIAIFGNNVEAWATNPQVGNIDYYAVADMRMYSGSPVRYGFVFDVLDGLNFYIFTVNPTSRHWSVQRIQNGVRATLREGVSSYVNLNAATNRLQVTVSGSSITAYINGMPVAVVSGGAFSSSSLRVGLVAKAGTNTVAARFDNLYVREQ